MPLIDPSCGRDELVLPVPPGERGHEQQARGRHGLVELAVHDLKTADPCCQLPLAPQPVEARPRHGGGELEGRVALEVRREVGAEPDGRAPPRPVPDDDLQDVSGRLRDDLVVDEVELARRVEPREVRPERVEIERTRFRADPGAQALVGEGRGVHELDRGDRQGGLGLSPRAREPGPVLLLRDREGAQPVRRRAGRLLSEGDRLVKAREGEQSEPLHLRLDVDVLGGGSRRGTRPRSVPSRRSSPGSGPRRCSPASRG